MRSVGDKIIDRSRAKCVSDIDYIIGHMNLMTYIIFFAFFLIFRADDDVLITMRKML